MRAEDSNVIPGVKVISLDVFRDLRGEMFETFSTRTHDFRDESGRPIEFVEDDVSISRRHTLRGLHGDSQTWKLIQCLCGEVQFVVADMRKGSPAYLRWEGFILSDENHVQVLVPAGCAAGHLVLSERTILSYKQSQHYEGAGSQFTVRWDDPRLAISWPVTDPVLSARDREAPPL